VAVKQARPVAARGLAEMVHRLGETPARPR
jgi:hypothetical protein